MSGLIRMPHSRLVASPSVVLLSAPCASRPAKSRAQVEADNGNVALGGYVRSDPAIDRAERVARHLPGVTSVVDRVAAPWQQWERRGGTVTAASMNSERMYENPWKQP